MTRPTTDSTRSDRWRVGVAAAGLLAATTLGVAAQSLTASAAPVDAGSVVVMGAPGSPEAGQALEGGGSASPFTLALPALAACSGDSATASYRVQSFMVPEGVDPASLTFGADGPVPSDFGAAYRQSLWLTDTSRYVDILTAQADTPGGPGMINTLPNFSFEAYAEEGASLIPAGAYTIGIACTVGPASVAQLDRYWTTRIEVVHDGADVPGGFVWEASGATAVTTTTTTSTTTTTVAASTTSTTLAGSTTTTVAGGTTTTTTQAGSSTTTSTTPSGASSTSTSQPRVATPVAGTPTGGGVGSGAGAPSSQQLAQTGSSSWQFVIWAVLLLAFGRIALLLGRTPKVINEQR